MAKVKASIMGLTVGGDKLQKCTFLKNKMFNQTLKWYEDTTNTKPSNDEKAILEGNFIEACYTDFPTFEPIYVARWLELKCGWPAADQDLLDIFAGILIAFNEAYPPLPE